VKKMKKNTKIAATTILFTLFLALFAAIPQANATPAPQSVTISICDKNENTIAIMEAHVNKLTGPQNELLITITKTTGEQTTYTFIIHNNAVGEYQVGSYLVYIATAGNDQIRDFYIVEQQEIVQPHTHIIVTDFTYYYDNIAYVSVDGVKFGSFEVFFIFKLSNGDSVTITQLVDGVCVMQGRTSVVELGTGSRFCCYPSDGIGCQEIFVDVIATTNRMVGDNMLILDVNTMMGTIPDFICGYE
jgi:hypothetical protein